MTIVNHFASIDLVAYKLCRLFNLERELMDKPASKAKQKRHLKDPETFREKALRAAEMKAKPVRSQSKIGNSIRSSINSLKNGIKKVSQIEGLKPLVIVLRFISRIIFPKYLRTSLEELKQVTWPSFKESRRLTYAVIIFAAIFGASIAAVDWGLGKVFKSLLLK